MSGSGIALLGLLSSLSVCEYWHACQPFHPLLLTTLLCKSKRVKLAEIKFIYTGAPARGVNLLIFALEGLVWV